MSKKSEQSEQEKPQKERKVKVVYYDDGSTVVDMSGTRKGKNLPPKQKSTFRQKARTFFTVMRNMVTPMLITLAAFTIVYILVLAAAGRLW